MQQKSKFIIGITLICFIFLLFLPAKVWSSNNSSSGGGGGSCTKVCKEMAYETVDYGYGPFRKYYCVKYYPLPPECFATTTTKEKEKKLCSNSCGGGCKEGQCIYSCSSFNDGIDDCQTDADCGGGTPPATSPPATSPPATSPPATSPPATSPPATSPPATSPPATSPPATSPPATSPPATSPPATSPPATSPPATSPPATSPPATSPPPPKCQIFEFSINDKTNEDRDPLFVWVNAVLKGYISVNDSCTTCTVTSDDTWGKPPKTYTITSISTYVNETFKIPTSGTYSFVLRCLGNPANPDDFDEDATSLHAVEALNLPWWREIIPVLPGFLRGIFR